MINEKEFEDFVFVCALENAANFNGKANSKPIFGKTISKFSNMKKDINHYRQVIENIVGQVNEMNTDDQREKLLELNPNFFHEQKENKKQSKDKKENNGLIDLPGHVGPFIGRFAPAPSGHLHIGGLIGVVFNYEYKLKYGGKFVLRLEDTNPENIDIKNYDKIIEDVKWITEDGIDEIFYQSDRLDIYYKYLHQLIETGKAYVCLCDSDTFKAFNDSSSSCPHRNLDIQEQILMYKKFFDGSYKDGDAVIRFKGDLENKNPALRDFPIARLNSTPHPRVGKKYKLWPMYNLAVSVDDALMGINYIVRGKDSEINGVRQDMVKDALGLKKVPFYHFGRIQFVDIELGKTPIRKKIEAGVYSGWDDPRLPTLISFRRRGFKAKAFREMLVSMGISKRDRKMSEKEYFKQINYFNKQILEKDANRYFFVHNPKEVRIENVTELPFDELVLPKHPDFKERGNRKMKLKKRYLIDGIDFSNIKKGDLIRLMHFANFKVKDKTKDYLTLEFVSKEFDRKLDLKRNIHFVPANENFHKKCVIVMQDAQKLKGFCEDMENPKVDSSYQFERFGFVRFDKLLEDGTYQFYFTHR